MGMEGFAVLQLKNSAIAHTFLPRSGRHIICNSMNLTCSFSNKGSLWLNFFRFNSHPNI